VAVATPWAILLCKFNDDPVEPQPRDLYEKLFTTAGIGSRNMVDFFADCSHGSVDVAGSRVFGWYTLNKKRSDYVGSGANQQGRNDLVNWARQAAADARVDLSPFFGVVVVMNVQTDLFGGYGRVVCDPLSMTPSFLGQEMGHGYGLAHSRIDGSNDDYRDQWDVMSTMNAYTAADPNYTRVGPGLNAANMRGRDWLDETRVWHEYGSSFSKVLELRPLHRRDLSGWLAAELPGGYLAEFRMNEGWDAAIPRPAVLVHRFDDNHSYLMNGTAGHPDLVTGEVFERTRTSVAATTNLALTVEAINPECHMATIRVAYDIKFHTIYEMFGHVSHGVMVDGGGWLILNGKVIRIPPRGPITRILEQMMLFQSVDLNRANPGTRDIVRREALAAITADVSALREEAETFHTPPQLPGKEHRH
jgi:hypothetical protein